MNISPMVTHRVSALKRIVLLSIHQRVPHTKLIFFPKNKKKAFICKSLSEHNPKRQKRCIDDFKVAE